MDEQLQKRVEIAVRKTLLSSVKSDTPEIGKVLSLNEKDFSFFVDEVVKSQTKGVGIAFRERQSLILPAFGFFKFRPFREKIFEEINKATKAYGYNNLREIKDPILKGLIMTNIKPILKQIYLDTIEYKPHKTAVLGNIFKK